MDALEILRNQAEFVDNLFTQIVAEVTAEQALWKPADSTANTISTIYFHAYHSEDSAIHRQSTQPSVFETGEWQQRLDVDPKATWIPSQQPDIAAYRAYAAEVRAATKDILSTIDPAILDREIESARGRRTVANLLSIVLVIHKATHMGEIAALLGCQGAKGFPF